MSAKPIKPDAAQVADHQLGEILRGGGPAAEHLFERRRNFGRLSVQFKIVEDTVCQLQLQRRVELRPAKSVATRAYVSRSRKHGTWGDAQVSACFQRRRVFFLRHYFPHASHDSVPSICARMWRALRVTVVGCLEAVGRHGDGEVSGAVAKVIDAVRTMMLAPAGIFDAVDYDAPTSRRAIGI